MLQKVATDLGLLHLEESVVIEGLMGLFWGTEVLNGIWCGIQGYGRADNLSDVVFTKDITSGEHEFIDGKKK